LGLSVFDANIHTAANGWCLNTFIVLDAEGTPPGRGQKQRLQLTSQIAEHLARPPASFIPGKRRLPRQLKQLPTATEVSLKQKAGSAELELTVIASDRPGLLATLGLLFAELGLNLRDARIVTLGERIEDTFTIVDSTRDSGTSGDRERIYLLENTIRQRLDSQIATEL
jgi:[protein-PII] uridylyltransferase